MYFQIFRKTLPVQNCSSFSNNHNCVIYSIIVLLLIMMMGCSKYSPVDSQIKYNLNISENISISNGLWGLKRKTYYTINGLAINGCGIELINKNKTDRKSFFIDTKNYGPIKFNLKKSNSGVVFIMSMTKEQKNKIKELSNKPLKSSEDTNAELKQQIKREELKTKEPRLVMTGGRSKSSILRLVMQNLGPLRDAYNKRVLEKPGLNGKITCKFAIDEFGKVIFCQMLESTMSDAQLETIVVDNIKKWVFEKIDKPGDVTEVVYPFLFSQ